MFNDTKYTRWYYNIIANARQHDRHKYKGNYYELHHITPRSLGGTDAQPNLVLLTAKEHYICHLLLPKMCVNSDHKRRMVFALMQLSEAANQYRIDNQHNSRLYALFKHHYIELISGPNCYMYGVPKTPEQRAKISATRIQNKTSAGENNPMYGKQHTEDSKQKMSEVKRQRIQERGAEVHKAKAIKANPKSRQVQVLDGRIFPSLSEAGRAFGFIGLTAPRWRIKGGEWKYV